MDPRAVIPHVLVSSTPASGALPAATGYLPMRAGDANGVPITRLVNANGNPFVSAVADGEVTQAQVGSSVGVTLASIALPYLFDQNGDFAADTYFTQDLLPDDLGGQPAGTAKAAAVVNRQHVFNGITFDALAAAAGATQNLTATGTGGTGGNIPCNPLQVAAAGNWAINHTPVAATQASIGRAAAPNYRHVCTSIHAKLVALAAFVGEANILINLRDGATGAGAILWSSRLYVAAGLPDAITLSGLSIVGSVNTAMTLEFAAAGGANLFETVALTGYTVFENT